MTMPVLLLIAFSSLIGTAISLKFGGEPEEIGF